MYDTDDITIKGVVAGSDDTRPMRADLSTHVLKTIDYAHSEIHSGSHFMYTDHVSLNDTQTQDYVITTPNTTTWAHMLFDLDGSAITQFQLFESTTRTGTTDVASGNNNRNSTDTATVTIYKGASTDGADGTQLHIYKGGASSQQSRQATGARNDTEIILKQNTSYLLRVTSGTNSNLTNIRLEWYEHANRP
jgi:hypothetical protein